VPLTQSEDKRRFLPIILVPQALFAGAALKVLYLNKCETAALSIYFFTLNLSKPNIHLRIKAH
jgi:hypothetical protein